MALAFRYEGYHQYPDTGRWYREWRIEKSAKALEAQPGDLLHDCGPGPEKRFRLFRDGQFIRSVDEEIAAAFLLVGVPPWDPPREDTIKLIEAVEKLGDTLRSLPQRTPATSTQTDTTQPEKSQAGGESNAYLRLKSRDTYRGGEAFTDWELLLDAPEVPASESVKIEPPHAIAGDVLREEGYDTELTPFKLYRGGTRIGSPEWFHVRHLFVGLRTEAGTADPDAAPKAAPADPAAAFLRGAFKNGDIPYWSWEAQQDVPGTPVKAGMVIVYHWGGWLEKLFVGPAKVERVSRDHYATIADHADTLRQLGELSAKKAVRGWRMCHSRRARANPATAPMVILHPIRSALGPPIHARSDDGAIFELLAEIGCRMPDPKRRERSRPSAAALAAVFLTEFCIAGTPATITPAVFRALERLVKVEGIPEREARALLTFARCCVAASVDRSIVQALRQRCARPGRGSGRATSSTGDSSASRSSPRASR